MQMSQEVKYNGKVALTLGSIAILMGIVVTTFWYQDIRYMLPTPRPSGLVQVPLGQNVESALPISLRVDSENMLNASTRAAEKPEARPLFVHFFQAGCSCSKFNLQHIADLTRTYGKRVRFVDVVPGGAAEAIEARQELEHSGIEMRCVADANGTIAARLGVYATPQAVLLDEGGALLYRGNYNSSRYCTSASTQFARLALEAHLAKKAVPPMPQSATRAYGCALPRAR
jgi:hypothetical protein